MSLPIHLCLVLTPLLISVTSCGNTGVATSNDDHRHAMIDGVKKTPSDKRQLLVLARGGDAKAATALGEHFLLVENDHDAAKHWFRMAAEHGGPKEKEVYQSLLESLREFNASGGPD